jgi:hypothetical protein
VIVVRRPGGLLLVGQLDHAAAAGCLARAWGNDGFEAPDPLAPVALAAARHDEGWREPDAEPRYDPVRRAPLNFLDADIGAYVRLYARGIDRIAALDAYAGLLASMHGTGNVCGRWGVQRGVRLSGYDESTWPPVIRRYVLEQEGLQSRLKLDLIGLNPELRRSVFERRLWANYELLQVWDRLSLFLCRTDPGSVAEMELGVAPTSLDGGQVETLRVRAGGDGSACVTPWPFAGDRVDVAVQVRTIPDLPYESQVDVAAEVGRAAGGELRWSLGPVRASDEEIA